MVGEESISEERALCPDMTLLLIFPTLLLKGRSRNQIGSFRFKDNFYTHTQTDLLLFL